MNSSSDRRKVAVFDIDGTIFRSSLFVELVNELIKSGDFPHDFSQAYNEAHEHWLDRKGDYSSYIQALVDAFDSQIAGIPFEHIIQASERVIETHKDRTYRYTRDLVHKLKEEGYFLLSITHSLKIIAESFCKNLGFDKVYGLMLELDDEEVATGNILHENIIFEKDKILYRAVEKEGLILENSIAVGDTESDIPMFEVVEKPICFNPNQKLYDHAQKNGWKVVVERKDVIYQMD